MAIILRPRLGKTAWRVRYFRDMMKSIRKLYDWTIRLSGHRHANWALAGISFAESSVFPIPPDVVLIPMCLAERKKAFYYALICTLASITGGMAGYAVGYFLYEAIGIKIIEFYGYTEQFEAFKSKYNEWGVWMVIMAGFTPIPYKIVTIASGVTKMHFAAFMLASIAGRAARFFLVAALLWKFGAPVRAFIEKYLGLLTLIFFLLLIGGFLVIKYIL